MKMNNGFVSRFVFKILNENIESRDNCLLTIQMVHNKEMELYGYHIIDYYDNLFSNKHANPQTIARIWRKIQEKNPELRGKNWEYRQKLSGCIAKDINNHFLQIKLF